MKKIAITQRLIQNDSYHELREALDVKWGLLFKALGFLPIILPVEYEFEEYFKSMKIDGILLTGGNDLSSIDSNTLSKKRDVFEKKLIAYGIENGIPIFGICRGMQIIAEYFGSDFKKVSDQVGIRHNIKANEESKYFRYLEKLGKVNSFHNYAVNNISEELVISAFNENGIIKAIEHREKKIFAQMWHTEREEKFDTNELNLIRCFFNYDK